MNNSALNQPKNRTAIVTGGAKGIGRAISEKLATDGWNLHLWSRDQQALEQFALELRDKYGVAVETAQVDLSKAHASKKVFERWSGAAHFPEAMICNSGDYGTLGPLAKVDMDQWKGSFDLNFFSIAEMIQNYCQLVLALPGSGRRSIVVMSGSGLGGSKVWPAISAYNCAKSALYRLVETVHEEMNSLGVDINCVAPGAVSTGITAQAIDVGEGMLGGLVEMSKKVQSSGGDSPHLAADTIATLLSPVCRGVSGRLISAKWDRRFLENPEQVTQDIDLLRLRRIDGELFGKISK